jgi:YD repeat-containing protein
MTDYVYHNTSYNDGKFKINLNTTKNSKVQTITNGFNIQTTINYKPLTDNTVYTKGSNGSYPNIDTQNARQVVSSVTTDNAIGSQNTTTYKYGGAKVNVKGRGNLGFAWIEKKDLQTNKLARTEYSQTYPYIGQITSTKEYIETNNSRQLLNSQTNIHQDKSSYSNKIHAPYSSQSLEKSYDLNSGNLLTTITTQQSNIDNYGNVGTIKVTTTGKNKTFIKTTRNTYNNNATKWHLGRLTASTVTHQAPNIPNIIRTSRFAYNNKGLLKSETIEPNTKKALTTTYNYDSFGNKIKATTSASGIASRSTTTEYSANGKFPIKATNALGHSETKTFDAKTGNILTLTGPNNLTTTWQYDTLGRKKLETRADSTTTSTNYQWAEDESPNSLYKITTTTSGSSPKTTYFDAFNRKVREQHTGFDGRKINSDTYYDNLGRVDRASLPYFTDEQGYFITTQYDAIGRLISSTKPADYGNTATNSTAYNGLTTINTNALGYQKTTTKNAIGKIIRIDEPESAWLTHQHDAIGNLTQTNVGGVTTTMTYDNRGNKISMNDPDMGRWTYTYNALGELINQTDAKNQTSTTSYDKLGRMTQRVEPEGTTNWQYDTKTNGIGKLAKVTALPDYKKEYSYDSLGRIGTTTTHVNNQSFNIQNQYDQYSRLSTQTRPQNFKVENVYNQYGYLMAKRAPKDQISDYDWEHLTKLTQDSLVNVEEALTKANEFEQKANVYRFVAKGYRQYADDATNISAEFTQKAQELRNNADLLEEVVVRLQKEAKQYTDSAKGYLIAARRFQHLSNVNVADDQERSYIDSNTNSKIGGYGFYSGGSIAAQSNTNGYAWCSNQAACVYWANASKQYAIINTNQAKQKLELAQRYINSSGVEKQAFANQEADNYDKKANDYTRYAVNYIDLSNEYLEQAQESVNQAKYWRGVAANAPDYQAMLADTNNIYFWRAKSRDASGRLTGHIVGNGLSTEQQYSPATGHLFAIKSGFGNTDGIRSLEYEYDLMNNVTQRQNHQSGLTEDFQYDELDRLTQSNTTGNIEGVTYNNGTSYQYDINGNITHKSDIGYYRYNPQRPHAIASINSNSPSSTDDYNANTATTGMLTINSSVTGNIETGNDTDWFKITLTAGQQVTFDLEGKPTQSGTLPDPYLRGIYNNTGTLISNTTNDDSGIGVNSKVIFTASTSNTYYISAGAYSRNTGTYTLTAIVTGSGASITPSLSDDYIYDANGNMTKNNNKIIQWTSFNKPKRFTKSNSNDNTTFVYAPNRSRYQKTLF